MNNLKIFENTEFGKMRTVTINSEPWFVGKDVAEALGYKDTSDAIKKHVLGEDKLTRRFADSGQNREMYIINESGLYTLIFGSKLDSAQRFKHWVTSEVLPAIRKTGSYAIPQGKELLALAVVEAQNTILELEHDKEFLSNQIIEHQKMISELRPKVNYLDEILQSKSLVLTTQIAKDYGMSARNLNKTLHSMGIQYKVGDQWVLYAKYQGCGYVHSRTINITRSDGRPDVKMQTEWTQKGRLFLYEALKKEGILPVIEQ